MSDDNKPPEIYGDMATVGISMAVGVAAFTFIGYKIDEKWGGGQVFTLLGVFMGLFYAAYETWKIVRKRSSE